MNIVFEILLLLVTMSRTQTSKTDFFIVFLVGPAVALDKKVHALENLRVTVVFKVSQNNSPSNKVASLIRILEFRLSLSSD